MPLAGIFAIAAALMATAYGITPHAVTVEMPMPYPNDDMGPLTPNVNRLVLTVDGKLRWNGEEISERQLGEILDHPRRVGDGAALLFTPEGDVPYRRALEVLDILRRHGAINRCFRFSGIQQYRKYEDAETFDDLAPYSREDCPPQLPEPSMPSYR